MAKQDSQVIESFLGKVQLQTIDEWGMELSFKIGMMPTIQSFRQERLPYKGGQPFESNKVVMMIARGSRFYTYVVDYVFPAVHFHVYMYTQMTATRKNYSN